eukprot:8078539-Ditylum_brightwellii.AAC.1
MEPWGIANSYPRTHRLSHWSQEGVEVDYGPRWSRAIMLAAVTRGPHTSALMLEAINLVHEDVAYQVKAGFCQVIPWESLKGNWPEHLKVLPVVVIPQIGRRGRIILDLSFPVYRTQGKVKKQWKHSVLQASVNSTTEKLALEEAVKDTGKVLPRIFKHVEEACGDSPIYYSKIDLADGYWRILVPDKHR